MREADVRDWISRRLFLWTLKVHRSRLNWREALKYTRHWKRCQKLRPMVGRVNSSDDLAWRFWRDGSVSMQEWQTVDFLWAAFRCEFTAFYTKSYRIDHTRETPLRAGSQLYHADGGPGTCIIVMRYDSNVTVADGPLQVVNWTRSQEIFAEEPRTESRDMLCAHYEANVKPWDRTTYLGPRNTVIAFMNNTLHRGGYPDPGHMREATVTHYYPSLRGEKVAKAKTDAYPRDPDI